MLQIENTIRGLIRVEGLKVGRIHRNSFSARVEELCARSPEMWQAIEPLLRARDVMRSQLKGLNLSLERKAKNDPICKLFMTIPGVRPLTSLTFKATIDDPFRFKSSKLVPAHLGLTPRVYPRNTKATEHGAVSRANADLAEPGVAPENVGNPVRIVGGDAKDVRLQRHTVSIACNDHKAVPVDARLTHYEDQVRISPIRCCLRR